MGFAWDFLIILKSASRSGQKASKTIGYSDGCANVRIHGAKQGTAGGWPKLQMQPPPLTVPPLPILAAPLRMLRRTTEPLVHIAYMRFDPTA